MTAQLDDAAPTFQGEGAFALWHFSEDPTLGRFALRPHATSASAPLVWAIDTRHSPLY